MNAKRILSAAALALVTAACAGGAGPTFTDRGEDGDGGFVLPTAPPTDTTGLMPEPGTAP